MKENIGIIGGGNIGTELAAELSLNNNVYLYTSNPKIWSNTILVHDNDKNIIYNSKIEHITDNLNFVCENCSIIIVTLPSNAFQAFAIKLIKCIKQNTKVIFVPGTGGVEYVFKELINLNCSIIGLQRVPGVYRLIEYGKEVTISGRRNQLIAASIPSLNKANLEELLEYLFKVKTQIVNNYLNITLTPSNPILHTSRLYTLFKNSKHDSVFNKNIPFYGDWDIESSKQLIACDNELNSIKKVLNDNNINLNSVKSLLEHYESTDEISLTKKISTIKSLHNLGSPMIKKDNLYQIDWDSRYFKADFPDGIIIIKCISILCNVNTPNMDKIIFWYQSMVNKNYFNADLTFGKDIVDCNIPQNFGIKKLDDLIKYYK